MEFQKIINLLDITSDDKELPDMLLRSGQKCMINQKKIKILKKKLDLKNQCLDRIYVILAMRILS